jgi:peptidoglycan/LPS O-acetylase OafA/YrhL
MRSIFRGGVRHRAPPKSFRRFAPSKISTLPQGERRFGAMAGTGAHRKDIDGLRAVAILPVLFYHANIWPFAGGYAGVDVFFVLSGYLITGLILREQAAGGFSIANFYDRRVRRILPALGAVLLVATIAALFVLLPDELVAYGNSLLGATLFYANILYWLRDADYFAPQAGQNPLLHIWSLAVEEQFYLFWPLLLVVLARFRRALPIIIALLAALSLGVAYALQQSDPNAVFYLLPTRAWQLLIGAFIAAGGLTPLRSALARNLLALAGLFLIGDAILGATGAPLMRSFNAALGTAVILCAAEGGTTVVSTILATRGPVFIGLISYSLYLWHWPALVYARLYLNRDLTTAEALAVLAAAFAVSVVSWRTIEQPLRRQAARWKGMPASLPVAAAAGAAFAAIAVLFVATSGLPARVPTDVRVIDADAAAPLAGKWCDPGDASGACLQGAFTSDAVLWGDSHARALAPGLVAFAAARHLRLREVTRSACPPLPGLTVVEPNGADYPKCAAFNRAALDAILRAPPGLVILEARWEVYFAEHRIRAPGDPTRAFSAALSSLLDTLGAHQIPVLVVGNVPRFADVPAHCYGRERMLGRDPTRCLAQPWLAGVTPLIPSDRLLFQAVAPRVRNARYHPAFTDLCDRAGCHAFSSGQLLYSDAHHLTPAGARRIGQALDAALQNWPR